MAEARDDLDMEYVLELAHNFDVELKNHRVEDPTIELEDSNPLCGDKFKLQLRVNSEGVVEDVGFTGRGCAISRASAYVLSDLIKGHKVGEVKDITSAQIIEELGIEINSAVRLKCASLALRTTRKGLVLAGHVAEEDEDEDEE
ncbi:iron-sulfur cluster assembly scaffold protein [Candidatus Chlorohelix sp.]|uniref:iron-sulfur cluster assembly scaffold protein n=1 Tax=Candidatus Chlorohelix sp. TaxID=3139201 RepID=UPI003074839A